MFINEFTDASNLDFQFAFRRYFQEFGITVSDWNGLFKELEEGQKLLLRKDPTEGIVGFIVYTDMKLDSWFFSVRIGFVRELWIDPRFRGMGHAKALLTAAERDFSRREIPYVILTSDTAGEMFLKLGYEPKPLIEARNGDPVYLKALSRLTG